MLVAYWGRGYNSLAPCIYYGITNLPLSYDHLFKLLISWQTLSFSSAGCAEGHRQTHRLFTPPSKRPVEWKLNQWGTVSKCFDVSCVTTNPNPWPECFGNVRSNVSLGGETGLCTQNTDATDVSWISDCQMYVNTTPLLPTLVVLFSLCNEY